MTIANRTVFIKQLEFQALIGVYAFEKANSSRLRLSLELGVDLQIHGDEIKKVVSYENILKGVEALALHHHRELMETLAEDIADFCLKDKRVSSVELTLDKPDMFAQTESVGIRLRKVRS